MDFATVELIGMVLLAVSSWAAGYYWRGASDELDEHVRIQYVDKPTIVDRIVEKLRIEHVEKPVFVDRPTVQIERVPHLIEKTTLLPQVAAAVSVPAPSVAVVFMDASERKVLDVATLDAKLRRPTVLHGARKFQCARQDAEGRYVYRQVAH